MYDALPANDVVRLLKLHPPQEGSEICCTLETIPLSAKPTYFALSYEWGEAKNKKLITLNGRQFYVRNNLWQFLSRLRHSHDDRAFWVDAVSINQDDIAERNQQVQIMAQIYECATAVWVWLGKDAGNVGDMFQLIKRLENPSSAVTLESGSAGSFANSLRQGVRDLSKRAYFTRTWIIQEVILARQLVIFCGEHSVDWDVLIDKCWEDIKSSVGFKSSSEKESWQKFLWDSTFILLDQARNRRKEYAGTDGYASLISYFGSSQCTDVRDKVYGLLGLLPEYRDRLQVDYAIPIPVLFFKALDLFEETHKVVSAEHLRRSLGLSWAQLYSISNQITVPSSSLPVTDSPTSIRVILVLAGPVSDIERRNQPLPVGRRHFKPTEPQRRRYFTFRFPHRSDDRDKHTYGLSVSQPLPGDRVQVFLEARAAIIFRKAEGGKLIAVGGATISPTLGKCLSLLAEAPDGARLAVLRDGLFSGVEATESTGGGVKANISIKALEGVLTTHMARTAA